MTDPTPPEPTKPLGERLSLDDLARHLRPAVGRLETERQSVRKGMLVRAGTGIGGGVVLALLLSLVGIGILVPVIVLALGSVGGIALASWHVRTFKNRAASALAPPVAADRANARMAAGNRRRDDFTLPYHRHAAWGRVRRLITARHRCCDDRSAETKAAPTGGAAPLDFG